jgi:hypothetical protein
MISFAARFAADNCDGTHWRLRLISAMLYCISMVVYIYDVCSNDRLSLGAAHRAYFFGTSFLKLYQRLAFESQLANRCLYKLRPKHHYFWEQLCEVRCSRINPRRSSGMEFESLLGKLSKTASRTHGATVSLRALQRHYLLLALRVRARVANVNCSVLCKGRVSKT